MEGIVMQRVRAFHDSYRYPTDQKLKKGGMPPNTLSDLLGSISKAMEKTGLERQEDGDPRIYRIHLMLEELSELVDALGKGDEVKAFDGALDLLYVTIGTCITFGWPVMEGFAEVHRSNMTKAFRPGTRMRDKGDSYEAPKLKELIDNYHYCPNCDGFGSLYGQECPSCKEARNEIRQAEND